MKVSRILVLQENAAAGREPRLNVLDHAVEFEFRPPELVLSRKVDAGVFAAVAAPIDCVRHDLLDTLGSAGSLPPLLVVGEGAVVGLVDLRSEAQVEAEQRGVRRG